MDTDDFVGCWFPVQSEEHRYGVPHRVPWSFVAPHEARAQKNHDQTLSRLAERGGLDLLELFCLVHDLDVFHFRGLSPVAWAAWLNRALEQHGRIEAYGALAVAVEQGGKRGVTPVELGALIKQEVGEANRLRTRVAAASRLAHLLNTRVDLSAIAPDVVAALVDFDATAP